MRHSRCFATSIALISFLGFLLGASAGPAAAKDHSPPREILFKDHRFTPRTLEVPAGEPLTLRVVNASNQTIEFESFKLNREVAMTPGQTVTVRLPALRPGSYEFYDDLHHDVPEGSIVAK